MTDDLFHAAVEEPGAPLSGPGTLHAANHPAAAPTPTQLVRVRDEALALGVNTDFQVTTADEANAAADTLGRIKGMHARLEKERKARVDPLREQINTINCQYTEPTDLLIGIEETLKRALLEFRGAEKKQIEEQRRLELRVAEHERARLEEQARTDREAAANQAAQLRAEGRDEVADAVLRSGESRASAAERTAQLMAAPRGPTEPTKFAGTAFRKVWKAKVIDLREFLAALLKSHYAIDQIVTVQQKPLDRLASSLQGNMDRVLPGSIAWEDEGIAARSK